MSSRFTKIYGASYATVSLSCTLPVFLAAVATTFEDVDLLGHVGVRGLRLGQVSNWVNDLGPGRIGVAILVLLAGVAMGGMVRRSILKPRASEPR